MKAEEIRIGNWIEIKGKAVQVNANHILHAANNPDNNYNPIRVTPEILKAAGFGKWKAEDKYMTDGRCEMCVYPYGTNVMAYGFCETDGTQFFLNYTNNLHHLQNLYRANVGFELQIDLSELPINL